MPTFDPVSGSNLVTVDEGTNFTAVVTITPTELTPLPSQTFDTITDVSVTVVNFDATEINLTITINNQGTLATVTFDGPVENIFFPDQLLYQAVADDRTLLSATDFSDLPNPVRQLILYDPTDVNTQTIDIIIDVTEQTSGVSQATYTLTITYNWSIGRDEMLAVIDIQEGT